MSLADDVVVDGMFAGLGEKPLGDAEFKGEGIGFARGDSAGFRHGGLWDGLNQTEGWGEALGSGGGGGGGADSFDVGLDDAFESDVDVVDLGFDLRGESHIALDLVHGGIRGDKGILLAICEGDGQTWLVLGSGRHAAGGSEEKRIRSRFRVDQSMEGL